MENKYFGKTERRFFKKRLPSNVVLDAIDSMVTALDCAHKGKLKCMAARENCGKSVFSGRLYGSVHMDEVAKDMVVSKPQEIHSMYKGIPISLTKRSKWYAIAGCDKCLRYSRGFEGHPIARRSDGTIVIWHFMDVKDGERWEANTLNIRKDGSVYRYRRSWSTSTADDRMNSIAMEPLSSTEIQNVLNALTEYPEFL